MTVVRSDLPKITVYLCVVHEYVELDFRPRRLKLTTYNKKNQLNFANILCGVLSKPIPTLP